MKILTTEIKGEDYQIRYNPATTTVYFLGALSLSSTEEYAPIAQLLDDLLNANLATLTLDLSHLEFLNSSGINMLSKFVIKARNQKEIQLIVKGSTQASWQSRSLKNLQRLMPSLVLEWKESQG